MPTAESKHFDIVIFGATGFTGQLVAEYFARNVPLTEVRWAIAGRNLQKLVEVREKLTGIEASCERLAVLSADISSDDSLLTMAKDTHVILTTVGPYAEYGEPLVRACIAGGTDYCDITGEPAFVSEIQQKYQEKASAAGVRIVNCCGFDSIPADAGALFTVLQLESGAPKRVRGFVSVNGQYSGGTWHSAVKAMAELRSKGSGKKTSGSSQSRSATPRWKRPGIHREEAVKGWGLPMPVIDPLIVKRSSRSHQAYGEGFGYGQYLRVSSLKKATGLMAGVAGVFVGAQFKPSRQWLLSRLKQGDGPDEETRQRSSFKVTFVGTAGSQSVVTAVSGGDAGYTETSKMLSECGLMLVRDRDILPKRSGILTPVEAFGETLIHRLTSQGITFELVERHAN